MPGTIRHVSYSTDLNPHLTALCLVLADIGNSFLLKAGSITKSRSFEVYDYGKPTPPVYVLLIYAILYYFFNYFFFVLVCLDNFFFLLKAVRLAKGTFPIRITSGTRHPSYFLAIFQQVSWHQVKTGLFSERKLASNER